MARITKKYPRSPPPSPLFLTKLPGEIRNTIYEFCILSSLKEIKRKADSRQFSQSWILTTTTQLALLNVSVLPRWSGPGHLRLEGIGPLPFMFVNRQINREIVSLVYSMVRNVSIGGYVLQRPGEDPSPRWECAYALLRARPDLLGSIKDMTITLPCVREAVLRGAWRELSMRERERGSLVESKPWLMLPGLVAFLKTAKSLRTLKVIVTADTREPPDLEQLLELYDICGHDTVMDFVLPHSPAPWTFMDSQWAARWTEAWAECLILCGRI